MALEQRQASLTSLPTFPDDLDALPLGSVVDGSTVTQDLQDSADYVVVGSGAAGATTAVVLAEAGYSVIILEEGPWIRTRQFGVDVFPALKTMVRDTGTLMAMGRAPFPLFQGRCVGGGTTVNSAIAWRAAERVIDRWGTEFGIGTSITNRALEPHYEVLERDLNVRAVADHALGNHNHLFGQAAQSLGIRAQRIQRYDGGCQASASCITGCRTGKKLGMNVTHVPRTLRRGGRIYTDTRVIRVESSYGRATAVHADFQAPGAPCLRVIARRGVVVAASAVQTPLVLKKSRIKNRAVGKHFQAHPGTSLTARFDRVVAMDFGATQGFNSTHFVDTDSFKIEALSLPPELVSARIPGVGPEFMRNLTDYTHLLNWAVVVRADAEGTIRNFLGKEQVSYEPTQADMARMRKGLKTLSEMMFAAGAKEIYPSIHGMTTLKSPDELGAWDNASLDPRAYGMMASHLFGSARMGTDPSVSAVGLDFQVHGMRGLYVVDSSVFPTNLGVNPQHTIMAVARLAAQRMIENPLPARG